MKREPPFREEAEVEAPTPKVIKKLLATVKETFYALGYRDFRLLWGGGWFSNVGTWIERVALGWLVYKVTGSSVSLGLVQFSTTIPVFFLSFYAGVVSDRISRKRILFWSNFFPMVLAFILGVLVSTNTVALWSIIVISFFSGTAFSFAFPSWQAIISDVVKKKDLMNAIALNSAQFHAARLVGPAIAGYLVAGMGLDWAFYINSATFLAVLFALHYMKYNPPLNTDSDRKWIKDVLGGFSHVRSNRAIRNYLIAVGLVALFGLSFYIVLLPIFAGDILRVGSAGYGLLMGFNGFGALIGALAVAWVSGRARPRTVLSFTIPGIGISLFLFGYSTNYYFSLGAMFVTGFFFLATNSTLNTAIQKEVDNFYRGRIMSIFIWMFLGLSPFGSLLSGFLGDAIGPRQTVMLGAFILLILGLTILLSSKVGKRKLAKLNGPNGKNRQIKNKHD